MKSSRNCSFTIIIVRKYIEQRRLIDKVSEWNEKSANWNYLGIARSAEVRFLYRVANNNIHEYDNEQDTWFPYLA